MYMAKMEITDSSIHHGVTDAHSTYQYEPLGPEQIRLLKIRPGCDFDQVRCYLHHFDIDKAPEYIAVSYRWGTSDERISIQIGSQTVEIMSNAWWALHYLRNHHIDKHLWLDAVCIDQRNNPERNVQVRRMGDIFSKAKEVMIWLGLEDEDTASAFEVLHGALNDSCYEPDPERYEISLQAAKHLFERDYWMRVWIVQEIAFANQLTIVCGEHRVTWDHLEIFLADVVPRWKSKFPLLESISNMSVGTLAERRKEHQMQLAGCSTITAPKLDQLLYSFRKFNCTEPCDAVYALTNLNYAQDHDKPFKIDYARTVNDLLMYTISYLTTADGELLRQTCTWLHQLLKVDVSSSKFQRWLAVRLKWRPDGAFDCDLESGEVVTLPCSPIGATRTTEISDHTMLALEDVSHTDIISWFGRNSGLGPASASRLAWWMFDSQASLNNSIVDCQNPPSFTAPRNSEFPASTREATDTLQVIIDSDRDRPLSMPSPAKMARDASGSVYVVCHDTKVGDLVFHTNRELSPDVVLRRGFDQLTVVGDAVLVFDKDTGGFDSLIVTPWQHSVDSSDAVTRLTLTQCGILS